MFKPKFYTKCKSSLKTTKTRIEVLKKKKGSEVKYLKSNIAELLSTGRDYIAYCRAEGLMIEQDRLSCYHLIDQFVECVSNNLSSMQKQSTGRNQMLTKVIGEVLRKYRQQTLETWECPEECREAVASLIYAAARFAEFPELRGLRTLFTEKYGNSLEQFRSKEFVEKLSTKAATKEMKLQLLHDIAQESSIDWDAKSLDEKLLKPPSPKQESSYDSDRQKKSRDGIIQEDLTIDKAVDNQASKDAKNGGQNQQNSSDDDGASFRRRYFTDQDSQVTSSTSVDSCSDDEVNGKWPFFSRFIPPYFKQKAEKEESSKDDSVQEEKPKPKPRSKPSGKKQKEASDDKNEEEKELDELLMHYPKKDSPGEPSEGQPYLKPPPSHYNPENAEGSTRQRNTKLAFPPGRAASEPTTPTKSRKSHARHNSLQNETLPGHVHPKLPDYDNLVAQMAALKGR